MTTDRLSLRIDERGVAAAIMHPADTGQVFDEALLEALTGLARDVAHDTRVRVLVLTGEGYTFCSGGDLDWLRRMRDADVEDNVRLGLRLEAMYRGLDQLPKPVVGGIGGDALGAGAGLAAVCDVAIAVRPAWFGFSDTHLGLVPAVVSPYVVAKVGPSFARAAFCTSQRFGAERALTVGLVHEVVDADGLDAAVERTVSSLLRGGPAALAAAKRLPASVVGRDPAQVAERNARLVSQLRASPEGHEGTSALLEGRLPNWVPPG